MCPRVSASGGSARYIWHDAQYCQGMKKNQEEMNIADNPLYHDTWKLLKKYRDVVWSLELSVQQAQSMLSYISSILA